MKCSYKKISALILALMMLLSVTGCTDNSASSLPEEKPSVYPFVNTLKEPDDNAMQAVEAPELTEQVKQKAEEVNREIVGWLQVPGTDINQPVVQTTNNSKYMRLNYEGKYSFQGCHWVDYECKVGTRETQSRNTIIYGHNTAVSQDDPNGLDFAQLLRFTDEEFAASHPYIFFSTICRIYSHNAMNRHNKGVIRPRCPRPVKPGLAQSSSTSFANRLRKQKHVQKFRLHGSNNIPDQINQQAFHCRDDPLSPCPAGLNPGKASLLPSFSWRFAAP